MASVPSYCWAPLSPPIALHAPGVFASKRSNRRHNRRVSVETDTVTLDSDDVMLREAEIHATADLISWNGLTSPEAEHNEATNVNWFGSDNVADPNPEQDVVDLLSDDTEIESNRDPVLKTESEIASKLLTQLNYGVSPREDGGMFGEDPEILSRREIAA